MSSNAKRLLSHFGGKTEYFHGDTDGKGGFVIETVYDLTDVIAEAKQIAEQTPGKDFRHVAKIPDFVLDQAHREGWFNDKQKWKAWANDPDNRMFRTWPGRL